MAVDDKTGERAAAVYSSDPESSPWMIGGLIGATLAGDNDGKRRL